MPCIILMTQPNANHTNLLHTAEFASIFSSHLRRKSNIFSFPPWPLSVTPLKSSWVLVRLHNCIETCLCSCPPGKEPPHNQGQFVQLWLFCLGQVFHLERYPFTDIFLLGESSEAPFKIFRMPTCFLIPNRYQDICRFANDQSTFDLLRHKPGISEKFWITTILTWHPTLQALALQDDGTKPHLLKFDEDQSVSTMAFAIVTGVTIARKEMNGAHCFGVVIKIQARSTLKIRYNIM